MNKLLIALMGLMVAGAASAALPPISDEAKAKAAETKNKASWGSKVSAYQLCQVQDHVVAIYLKSKNKPKPAFDAPPCSNPGPYVALQAASSAVGVADAKPIPEVGAKK